MDPTFNSQLDALVGASGGLLRRGGGDRDINAQIALRKKNGCPDIWTAPASSCRIPTAIPGRSMHNHGFAEDIIDASTGKAVQAGSAADKWLAANAARFGIIRPVGTPGKKGWEPWHLEPADRRGINGARSVGLRDPNSIGFDLRRQDAPGSRRDELAYRLDAIGQMLGAGAPEMPGVEQMPSPEQMPSVENPIRQELEPEPEMRMDETTIGGGPQGVPAPGQVPAGRGVDRWRGLVAQALQYVGEEPSEANIALTLRRMQQESGGDPNALNDWDSNARRGTPSIGLMQVILPTFNAHAGELAGRGQRDPFANLVASMRYAKSRYGSLASAYGRKGGY